MSATDIIADLRSACEAFIHEWTWCREKRAGCRYTAKLWASCAESVDGHDWFRAGLGIFPTLFTCSRCGINGFFEHPSDLDGTYFREPTSADFEVGRLANEGEYRKEKEHSHA